jgi:hypothetical protein
MFSTVKCAPDDDPVTVSPGAKVPEEVVNLIVVALFV